MLARLINHLCKVYEDEKYPATAREGKISQRETQFMTHLLCIDTNPAHVIKTNWSFWYAAMSSMKPLK